MSQISQSHLLPVFARVDVAFERGEGVWLVSTNGDRYLDFGSGVAANGPGHCHPHLVKAMTEQLSKVWPVSNLYKMPDGEKLAARLRAGGPQAHRRPPSSPRRTPCWAAPSRRPHAC